MSPTQSVKHNGAFVALGGSTEETVDPYVRPSDWLALPVVNVGEQKLVGLYAVGDNESNFIALSCAGAYTVDWGDGTVEDFASGVVASRNYAYSALGAGTLSERGYRQAVVTVTPQAGQNLTTVNLFQKHPQTGLVNAYGTGWLDIRMAGANVSTLTVSGSSTSIVRHRTLEQFEFVGPAAAGLTTMANLFHTCVALQNVVSLPSANVTSFSSMFNACSSLQTIPLLNTVAGTSFSSMFSECRSLRTVPLLDTANGTTFANMFSECRSLRTVPLLNTAAGTSFNSMFSTCSSLQSIPLLNTAAGTNFSFMFNACSSLQVIPFIDTARGTDFSCMFQTCPSLVSVPLLNVSAATAAFTAMFTTCSSLRVGALSGTKGTISYASCALGPAALNDIYANLASGVSGQTVTVSNNWGTTGDDPSIATAKGWTVTGS